MTNHDTQLELNDDDIGDEGVVALVKSVKSVPNHKLCKLNLQDNIIGDRGAIAMAELLAVLTELRVDLSYNRIGIEGHKALLAYEDRVIVEENPATKGEAPLS